MFESAFFINVKVIWNGLVAGVAWALVWAGVDEQTYTIFAVLLVFDYLTGITKAFILEQKITSNRSKYGIASKLSLLIIPVILGLGGKAVDADFALTIYWAMNVLILSEVYSIVGNIYSIRSGEEMPEFDAVQAIGKRIRLVMTGNNQGD